MCLIIPPLLDIGCCDEILILQTKKMQLSRNCAIGLSIILQLIHYHSASEASEEATDQSIVERCHDCKLMSDSIEELIRKPRQLNGSNGETASDLPDLDRLKKNVCKNYMSDKERQACRAFFFTNLPQIEKWKQLKTRTNSYDTICIKELKLCCSMASYGPKCSKCPQCAPNQQCHGHGTRRGSGKCICKEGYQGPKCSLCVSGFYSPIPKPSGTSNNNRTSADSKDKLTCLPCHKSCKSCRREGPLGCEVCNKGYTWSTTFGCFDIDECARDSSICGTNTFCVNTEGSYYCYECDRACDGCHGDGPDMCLKCGRGYKLENGNCVALKKSIIPPEANYYSQCCGPCGCSLHNCL